MSDQNLLHILEESVPVMMERRTAYMEMFNKNNYRDAFEQFLEDQQSWLAAMGRVSKEDMSDNGFLEEIADRFILPAQDIIAQVGSGSKQDKELLDLNMYMVTYVLPGILESCDRKDGKVLADAICAVWTGRFKRSHIQAASYADIDAGFKRKLCYITTATCEALQLGEDCEELSLMRQYRDGFLSGREDGKDMIREYYDIAPTIVKRINKTERAGEEYVSLYEKYISKCVQMIKDGAYEECLAIYKDMVLMLKDRFLITKRPL